MSMLTNLDLIRRVPLFSMLTNDQAQAIADSVVKRRFRRGELVVEQGRKSNALYILLNGRARVLTSDSRGREVILAVLESGDYVGEMSLIDNEAHSATVRCEIQTDMLILGRADFARCLPENSSLSYAILRGLVRRLRHLTGKSNHWPCSMFMAVSPAPCWKWLTTWRVLKPSATRCRARTWPRWWARRVRWSAG